jgi:DNA-binding MarR family transcriptional regulator
LVDLLKERPTKKVPFGVERTNSMPEPWLENWFAVRPDLDRIAIAMIGRIIRMNSTFETHRAPALASLGLTPEVSDLIISLLRVGPPHELNAGLLARHATYPTSTSGSMTYRIDRAEALGLVERHRDPKDRRGVIVRLTAHGREIANRDVDLHMTLMREVLSRFDPGDLPKLADFMKTLLDALAS